MHTIKMDALSFSSSHTSEQDNLWTEHFYKTIPPSRSQNYQFVRDKSICKLKLAFRQTCLFIVLLIMSSGVDVTAAKSSLRCSVDTVTESDADTSISFVTLPGINNDMMIAVSVLESAPRHAAHVNRKLLDLDR